MVKWRPGKLLPWLGQTWEAFDTTGTRNREKQAPRLLGVPFWGFEILVKNLAIQLECLTDLLGSARLTDRAVVHLLRS